MSDIPTAHFDKDHYMNPHNVPEQQPKLDEIAEKWHYKMFYDALTPTEMSNKDIIKSAMLEYAAELQQDKEREHLVEALRKAILWAEACSFRIEDREQLNWTYLNEARAVYATATRKVTK